MDVRFPNPQWPPASSRGRLAGATVVVVLLAAALSWTRAAPAEDQPAPTSAPVVKKKNPSARGPAERMLTEFQNSAEAAALRANFDYMKKRADEIRKSLKNPETDPVWKYHQAELKRIEDEYQKLADATIERIREKLNLSATAAARSEAEFRSLPEVKALLDEIDQNEKEIKRVGKVARTGADPALNWLRQERTALEERLKKLWDQNHDPLSKKFTTGKGTDRDRRIREIESTVRELLEEVKQLREDDGKE